MSESSSRTGTKRPRLQCPHCKETLSYYTYCRHQQTLSCIAVSANCTSSNDSSDSDSPFLSVDEPADFLEPVSDSTVDHEQVTAKPLSENLSANSCDALTGYSGDSETSSSGEGSDDSLAPEIWDAESDIEDTESSKPASRNTKSIHYVLSYFLLFFQLCYHVSDRGLQHIIHLLSSMLYWLSSIVCGNNIIMQLSSEFPKTIYSLRKAFGMESKLVRYCVCPVCHTLYKEAECIVQGPSNTQVSRKCNYVEFPNHRQRRYRIECGTDLMKTVKVGNNYKLVPRKLYIYNSISSTIQQFASRPGFFESCESWRNRTSDSDGSFMSDVYDGKLWRDWQSFVAIPGNLLLMLNVDWFRPYKHMPYSVGVIYLVIQNLPRTIRFKPENIIIVGTIPGPHEPKLTINTYLKPMVDELLDLWKGIKIESKRSILGGRTVRVALGCISSDIPATRKVCGFYGFKAKHGCSKCLKEFPKLSFSDITDYSGFQRDQWPSRDIKLHKKKSFDANKACTIAARTSIEQEIGVRYSELIRLPYLNVVRCHVVDPMHNLFLGTAKNITKLWKSKKIISESGFESIQTIIDSISVPARVGRLPHKIASGFSAFTAEQWMTWTIIYSPFILKQFLPHEHYILWCLFSLSCSLFCRPFIHHAELVKADQLIMDFCIKFEQIFGKESVTPNMHMHAHLQQCIEDFGPVYSFWCFSFERYNGILEHMKKNWHAPEIQIMEKFTLMQTLNATDISMESPPELLRCLNGLKSNYTMLEDNSRIFDSALLFKYEQNLFCLPTAVCAMKLTCHIIVPPLKEKFLLEDLRDNLHRTYSLLYGSESVQRVPMRYEEFSQIEIFGQVFTSQKSRSKRSCVIMAIWPSVSGSIINHTCNSEDIRVGEIEYFFVHVPDILSIEKQPHIFAKVKWYQDHPRKHWYKNSIIVSSTLFTFESEASFLPVSRIMSRCAVLKYSVLFDYGMDNVNVCMPLIRRVDE